MYLEGNFPIRHHRTHLEIPPSYQDVDLDFLCYFLVSLVGIYPRGHSDHLRFDRDFQPTDCQSQPDSKSEPPANHFDYLPPVAFRHLLHMPQQLVG